MSRSELPKPCGSNQPAVTSMTSFFRLVSTTGKSLPPNSKITWRQAPHGEIGSAVSPVTASMAKSPGLQPCATALKNAVRSAQLHKPYAAFSTLQPRNTRPSLHSKAAPTLKREYGAYASSRPALASAISSCLFILSLSYNPQQRDTGVVP